MKRIAITARLIACLAAVALALVAEAATAAEPEDAGDRDIVEVVVVRVKADRIDDYKAMRGERILALSRADGALSLHTYQDVHDPAVFVHRSVWLSEAHQQAAEKAMDPDLKKRLADAVEQTIYRGFATGF